MPQFVKQRWVAAQSWFTERSLREKVLLCLSTLIVVFVLVQYVWIQPAQQRSQQSYMQVQQQQAELAQLSQEAARFQRDLDTDPNEALAQRKLELEARKERLEARMAERAQLMPAGASVAWIEAMLVLPAGLELQRFDTRQPVPMVVPDANTQQPNVWRHGVEISVTGRYHQLREYVENIDALGYPFYWHSLRYQVEQHPVARLHIRVYALSTERELVGG